MLCADKTITVINVWYDADADKDVCVCHTFPGCSWYARNKAAVDSAGLHHARLFSIRIPEAAAAAPYYPPQQYKELPAEEKATGWTLALGCKVTLRAIERMGETEFAALSGEDVCTVLDARDNRGRPIPHWYVEGA